MTTKFGAGWRPGILLVFMFHHLLLDLPMLLLPCRVRVYEYLLYTEEFHNLYTSQNMVKMVE
jgi:hypothetical protein